MTYSNTKAVIYTLSDPDNNEIRYVGRTIKPFSYRFKNHIQQAKLNIKKDYCHCWIRSLLNSGKLPIGNIVETTYDLDREKYWIKKFKDSGCDLTNLSEGGELSCLGSKRTPDQIKNIINGRISNSNFNILELDSDYNIVKTWNSYREAADYAKLSLQHMHSSIRRNARINGKYFILKNNYDNFIKHKSIKKIELLNVQTMETLFFDKAIDFCKKFNCSHKIIENYSNKDKLYLGVYKITNNKIKNIKLI